MGLDLRLPLGLMFLAIGVIMLSYGLLTLHSNIYLQSMGANVNVIWGSVLALFGVGMLLLARRARAGISKGSTGAQNASAPQRNR